MSDDVSDAVDAGDDRRGRLFLVTGTQTTGQTTVARALASRSERAVAIDGDVFDHMVVSGRDPYDEPPRPEQLRQLFLRWSAAIATAETYQLEGFDAVISDNVLGGYLEDFLDLASPEPVHLIVLHSAPASEPVDHAPATPRWGLWIDISEQTVDETVTAVLARLEQSVVTTDSAT